MVVVACEHMSILEPPPKRNHTQHHPICNISKVPPHGYGNLSGWLWSLADCMKLYKIHLCPSVGFFFIKSSLKNSVMDFHETMKLSCWKPIIIITCYNPNNNFTPHTMVQYHSRSWNNNNNFKFIIYIYINNFIFLNKNNCSFFSMWKLTLGFTSYKEHTGPNFKNNPPTTFDHDST
jgi:hypothetical protein